MDKKNVTVEEEDLFCQDEGCVSLEMKPSQHNFIEETSDGESQVQNPLQNHLILQQVMSYLNNLEDLKNCRLVHSTWTDEASMFLKKKSIFKVSKGFLKSSKEVINSLEVFQPQNLELFPRQYRCSRVYSKKDWGIVKKQITKLSDGIKSLKFLETEVTAPGRIQSFTEILHYNFPNLVQLTLGNSEFSWPNPPPPPIPSLKRIYWIANCRPSENDRLAKLILLEGVLKLAPNLESLKLREEPWYYFPERANMFLDHLNSHPSSCPSLKDLNLYYLLPLDIVPLANLKIKLRSLKFRLPVMADYQIIQDFLKRQNGTLETLRLTFPSYFKHPQLTYNFTFPCLPNLKKLKLVHGDCMEIRIEDVEYAKQFPVLQSLLIKYTQEGRRGRPRSRGIEDRTWLRCPLYGAFLPLFSKDSDKQVCKSLLQLSYPNKSERKLSKDYVFGIRERLSSMFPNVHNEDLNIGRARVAELLKAIRTRVRVRTVPAWTLHLVQQCSPCDRIKIPYSLLLRTKLNKKYTFVNFKKNSS